MVGRYDLTSVGDQRLKLLRDYEAILAKLAVFADLELDDFAPPVGTERLREDVRGSFRTLTRLPIHPHPATGGGLRHRFFRWPGCVSFQPCGAWHWPNVSENPLPPGPTCSTPATRPTMPPFASDAEASDTQNPSYHAAPLPQPGNVPRSENVERDALKTSCESHGSSSASSDPLSRPVSPNPPRERLRKGECL